MKMWFSINHIHVIIYMYITCLFTMAVTQSDSQQSDSSSNPILSVDVDELTDEEIEVVCRINFAKILGGDPSVEVILASLREPEALEYKSRRTVLDAQGAGIILIKLTYDLSFKGITYRGVVRVSLGDGDWVKDFIYNSVPLPPQTFRVSKRNNKIVFEFRTPKLYTNRGIRSLYDFMRLNCQSTYLSTRERREYWEHNYNVDLNKTENLTFEKVIDKEVQQVFKAGGFVNCTLAAVSIRGAYLKSPELVSSLIINPVLPTINITSQSITESGEMSRLIVCFEFNLVAFTFSRIEVKDNSTIYCTRQRAYVSSLDCECVPEFPIGGVRYKLITEIWSNGPVAKQKSALTVRRVVLHPRPPRSMNVTLINNEVIISLDVESPDTNKFDKLYINSSNNPTYVRELKPSDNISWIKWNDSFSPGETVIFSSWTSVAIGGNSYFSSILSLYYSAKPPAPFDLTFFAESEGTVSLTWKNHLEKPPDRFIMTICEVTGQGICHSNSSLNYSVRSTEFKIVQQLDMDKNYRAWIEAITNGVRSARSNVVNITMESQSAVDVDKTSLTNRSTVDRAATVASLTSKPTELTTTKESLASRTTVDKEVTFKQTTGIEVTANESLVQKIIFGLTIVTVIGLVTLVLAITVAVICHSKSTRRANSVNSKNKAHDNNMDTIQRDGVQANRMVDLARSRIQQSCSSVELKIYEAHLYQNLIDRNIVHTEYEMMSEIL